MSEHKKPLGGVRRGTIEVCFIIFLFYCNLLMGEFTRSNGYGKSLRMALRDIVTIENFGIALISAMAGFLVFEFLRKQV